MADVPATLVKELRELTGAGMMDCKRALQDTDGDLEDAAKLLREKGIAAATKRAGRETTEGVVLAHVENGTATLVAVGCETEPVSKNAEFREFAAQSARGRARGQGPERGGGPTRESGSSSWPSWENVAVRGAERFVAGDGETVSAYVHPPAQKIGVLVKTTSSPRVGEDARHAHRLREPAVLGRSEVPESAIEEERALYEKLPDVASKPDEIRAQDRRRACCRSGSSPSPCWPIRPGSTTTP